MKKFTKFLCGAAFLFVIAGFAFCIASLCLGFGGSDMQQIVSAGSRQFRGAQQLLNGNGSGAASQGDVEFENSYTGIQKLKLDAAVAECVLIPCDGEKIQVTGYHLPDGFVCEKSGSVLHIKTSKDALDYIGFYQETSYLEIQIPEALVFDSLEIDAGVGEVSMDGIISCRNADVECGVGSCELQLDVRGKLELECGVGEVNLLLAGEKTDYNYHLECGIGSIQINGDIYSELGGKQKLDHGADRDIYVDCGIGAVTVLFYKNQGGI